MELDVSLKSIIFSPQDRARISDRDIQCRRVAALKDGLDGGMPLYINKDDQGKIIDLKDPNDIGFLPILPGEMVTVIARPGNGKTAFLMRTARERAKAIRLKAAMGDEDAKRRVVVYVTYEQPVEELNAFHIAASMSEANRLSVTAMAMGIVSDEQMEEISAINTRAVGDPLWVIGHSMELKRRKPQISVSMMEDALYGIKDWLGEDNQIIDSVYIDYLQKIPYDKREGKTIGISDNSAAIKTMLPGLGTRAMMAAQAVREVGQREDPTPTMEDGQWTSSIEQDSDGFISIMRPSLYRAQMESVSKNSSIVVEGYNQMKLAFLKRKLGPANFERWINFDVAYNRILQSEMKYVSTERQ